ncbi:hypothetical protein MRX96_004935 [Rhipicephalus microplus]
MAGITHMHESKGVRRHKPAAAADHATAELATLASMSPGRQQSRPRARHTRAPERTSRRAKKLPKNCPRQQLFPSLLSSTVRLLLPLCKSHRPCPAISRICARAYTVVAFARVGEANRACIHGTLP